MSAIRVVGVVMNKSSTNSLLAHSQKPIEERAAGSSRAFALGQTSIDTSNYTYTALVYLHMQIAMTSSHIFAFHGPNST